MLKPWQQEILYEEQIIITLNNKKCYNILDDLNFIKDAASILFSM
jgi:hypothetical protein